MTPQLHNPSKEVCNITAMLDALQCGAMLVTREGRIVHANGRLCEMLQRPLHDLLDLSLFDLYPEEAGRSIVEYALENFHEPREQEFFLPRPDGSTIPIHVSGRHLHPAGSDIDYRVVTVIDITAQKQAELELHERYKKMLSLSDTVLEQALALKHHADDLEQRVQQRTGELHNANMEAIYMLAVASEAKDADTGAHVRRIAHYTRLIAEELKLPADQITRMSYSSILHDVGKIHVPDHILQKPGALTEEEWKIMREHTVYGERILSREPFFDIAREIVRSHHENWDGSGYPDGLAGDAIPLSARIVRVVDVYDALTGVRPYKKAWTPERSAGVIEQGSGSAFDPDVARVFVSLFRERRLSEQEC